MSRRDQTSENLPEHLSAGAWRKRLSETASMGASRDRLISAERDGYFGVASPPITDACQSCVL